MLSRGPGRSRFTLAVLVVISVTVLVVDLLDLAPLGTVRDGAAGVLSPVRAAGDAVFGGGDDGEVAELRERVAELEGADAELANVQAELDRLRDQLRITPPEGVAAVAAEVIGGPVSNFDRTIEIDRGSDAGIEPGMPVRNRQGLVGVIDRVSFTSARIELITSTQLAVGVRHSESGDLGVARGQGEGEPLIVDSAFEVGTEVADDDVFVTSGLDRSEIPGGIPVGRATAVRQAPNPLEQQVILRPLADLGRMSHVAVLLYHPPAPDGAG